jgi:hypothetical protein
MKLTRYTLLWPLMFRGNLALPFATNPVSRTGHSKGDGMGGGESADREEGDGYGDSHWSDDGDGWGCGSGYRSGAGQGRGKADQNAWRG